MALYRYQVVLKALSGVPADNVTNTLYYDAVSNADALNAADDIGDFYLAIDGQLGSSLATTGHEIKVYAMSDPEPRFPIGTPGLGGALAPSTSSLPRDVALCLSFQGARVSGTPQASRRGRIYLGPLTQSLVTVAGIPNPSQITPIVNAAIALLAASDASANYTWVIYSPTLGTFTPVTDGWIDNEFDTQRSRGLVPTIRNAWS